MRIPVLLCTAATLALAHPSPAAAQSSSNAQLSGVVRTANARWNSDHSRIVTESVIRRADGTELTLVQPGGTVNGIGMISIPAPPVLRAGATVTVSAVAGADGVAWVRDVSGLARKRAAPSGPGIRPLPFVRTTNDSGAALSWASGCAFITYDSVGTTHIAGDGEFATMDAVFARWRTDTASCSYFQFELRPPEPMEVGFDRINIVKFREAKWCRPATKDDPEECYDPGAAGLTTLFFIDDDGSKRNGEILDADIELNAINFSISTDGNTLGQASCLSDLTNTLTHEVGHLMGLDHTCHLGQDPLPIDDQGNTIPSCSSALTTEVTEATMYNFQECGETKKASPESDDLQGVCAIYPLADDPDECKEPTLKTGCCAVGAGDRYSGGSASLIGSLILAFVAVSFTRRRKRRRR